MSTWTRRTVGLAAIGAGLAAGFGAKADAPFGPKVGSPAPRVEALKDQIEGLRQSRTVAVNQGRSLEEQLADRLDQASEKLEQLALAFNPPD